jgi:hypothetical protein
MNEKTCNTGIQTNANYSRNPLEVHGCWLNATDISMMLPELQNLEIKSWSSSL